MATESTKRASLKERAEHEFVEYLAIAFYLWVFFGALLSYRRIVLAEVGLAYAHYGFALVEALVLSKVILIGDALHIGRRLEAQPLIVSAAYKSVLFGAFVLAFMVLEHTLHAVVKSEGIGQELAEAFGRPTVIVARVLLVILSFIPFFLFREAGRLLGEEGFLDLLLKRRSGP